MSSAKSCEAFHPAGERNRYSVHFHGTVGLFLCASCYEFARYRLRQGESPSNVRATLLSARRSREEMRTVKVSGFRLPIWQASVVHDLARQGGTTAHRVLHELISLGVLIVVYMERGDWGALLDSLYQFPSRRAAEVPITP